MPRFQGVPVEEAKGPRFKGEPVESEGNWYDAPRAALQGATFGFSDEVGSAIAAAAAKLTGDDRGLGDIYGDIQETVSGQQDAYAEENPARALALEAGGGIATGGIAGAKALGSGVAKNAPRWLRTAGVGAAEGAAYGAGTADPGSRVGGAAKGGGIGAVAAPVGSAALSLSGKMVSPVARRITDEVTHTPRRQAEKLIRGTVDDAGLDADEVVSRYNRLGVEGMLADVDENLRGLTRGLSDKLGTAKSQSRAALESRQMGQADRLISRAQQTLGKNADEFTDTVSGLKQVRSEKAGPLYQEAYTNAAPSEDMLRMAAERPSLKGALAQGKRIAADEGEDIADSSFKQFHYAKMALDSQIAKKIRSEGVTPSVRAMMKTKRDLLGEMDSVSPSYREARDLFAGDSALLDAAAQGQQLFKLRPDAIDDITKTMSASEKELFRHGAVKAIVDKLEDQGTTGDATKKLLGSKSMRRRLGALFDSEGDAREFVEQAAREREFGRTRQVVAGGSPTSQNLAVQQGIDEAVQAGSALLGPQGSLVSGMINWLKAKPITPETIDEAARILVNQGLSPDEIRRILSNNRVISGAAQAAPTAGNAFRGSVSPAVSATQD